MAIKNSVSNDFLSMFVDSIYVFDCLLEWGYVSSIITTVITFIEIR